MWDDGDADADADANSTIMGFRNFQSQSTLAFKIANSRETTPNIFRWEFKQNKQFLIGN
jgi:hypothetical protein